MAGALVVEVAGTTALVAVEVPAEEVVEAEAVAEGVAVELEGGHRKPAVWKRLQAVVLMLALLRPQAEAQAQAQVQAGAQMQALAQAQARTRVRKMGLELEPADAGVLSAPFETVPPYYPSQQTVKTPRSWAVNALVNARLLPFALPHSSIYHLVPNQHSCLRTHARGRVFHHQHHYSVQLPVLHRSSPCSLLRVSPARVPGFPSHRGHRRAPQVEVPTR